MASNQFIARKGIIALDDAQITGSLSVTDNISSNTLTVTSGITGTATSASYVEYSNVAGKPTLVSGSSQVSFNGIVDKPTLVSGSSQITYSGLSGIPAGIVSGSEQVSFNGIVDKPTLVSGSSQVSFNGIVDKPTLVSGSSQVTYSGLTGIPAGIVSGSSQITYSGISNIPSGIVSGSSQVSFNGITDKPTLISGSSQVTYSGLSGIPSGIVSGSSQVTYSGLTGIPVGIVSSSAQIAGYNLFATTGSNQFDGSQAITGSLTVTGQVVAQTLNVQQVTSSIVFSSGSNIFGNSLANTQQFTGSVSVTGSLTVVTAGTELQVTSTGVNLGNALTDSHIISGSLRVNPNGLFVSGSGVVGIGTTSPGAALDINSNSGYRVRNGSTDGFQFLQINTNTWALRGLLGNDNITFTNGTGAILVGGAATFSSSVTISGGNDLIFRDSSNYISSPATDTLRIVTANTERMRITAGGNVGIGTTTPTAGRFQINVSDTTTAAHFQVVDGTTTLANSFVTNFRNANDGNGRYSLSSWQAQNASGNDQIGFIGVQSVTGASNYTPNLIFGQKTGVSSFTTRMTLDTSGNLGLGTTPSPWTSTHKVFQFGAIGSLETDDDAVALSNNRYFDGANKYRANDFASIFVQVNGQHQWFTAPSGLANNTITFTQAMTLSAAGRLLIGKTNDEGFALDVVGTGRFSGNLFVSNPTDCYPEFITAPSDADVFLGFTNTGDGNNAWGVGRRNTGEFWITNFTGNFNSGTRTTVLSLASTGAATFSSSVTATQLSVNTTNTSGKINIQGPNDSGLLYLFNSSANARFMYNHYFGFGIDALILQEFNTSNVYVRDVIAFAAGGKVGIGTASPRSTADVNGILTVGDGNPPTINVYRNVALGNNASFGSINFGARYDGTNYGIGASLSTNSVGAWSSTNYGGNLIFATTPQNSTTLTERMRITSDGYVRLTSSSGGIQFNGDTAAANALDDYEEGTWSMGVSFGGASVGVTTTNNTGKYTKIGRQVTVTGYLQLSSKGSSTGDAKITGLPFTVFNAAANYSTGATWLGQITYTGIFMTIVDINSTTFSLFEMAESGVRTSITNADFANNSDFIISLTYFTS
jgi:hypothetical protein